MDNVAGILKEYYEFCKIYDKHHKALNDKKETLEEAIAGIFDGCEAAGALVEYLRIRRMEVERILSGLLTQEMVDEMTQRSDRIEGAIQMGRGMGLSEEKIKNYLVRQFGISEKYAQNFLDLDPDRDRDFVPLV